ncbi:hypothetical protein O3M35_004486 [Rhynocoris fuscipes]|uniref:LsmAD domain-containing protein n=1 Tax=Rhynocoris fuscipes TaxID=488301 RepID=A0AAW1CLK1_9HEMI
MNTKRKNRSNSARSPRPRSNNEKAISMDGVYNNSYFMNSVTSLIGNTVKVHTLNGCIYEGIFRTFSPQFEIAVELAHKIDINNPLFISMDSIVDKIIFKPHDIIKLEILDTDVEFATRDTFQTDTAISKFNGQVTEKELEPWDGPGNNIVDDLDLDGTANGWDVNDMFRQNEKKYGLTSNFDQGLSAYTTPLQNKDSKDYKDAEAKAAKIANEIENNPHYKSRIEVENGDEEDKYSAVSRPVLQQTNDSSNSNCTTDNMNKYVCPPKRKTLQGNKGGGSVRGTTVPTGNPYTNTGNQSIASVSSVTCSQTPSSPSSLTVASNNATLSNSPTNLISTQVGIQQTNVVTTNNIVQSTNQTTSSANNTTNKPPQSSITQQQIINQSVVLVQTHLEPSPPLPRTGRLNGTTDPPKPQRTNTNSRTGNIYFINFFF